MAVEGEVTDSPYHFTQEVASGDIEGESYSIGLDVGGGGIIVNFTDREEKVIFQLPSLLKQAYSQVGEDFDG